MVRCTAQPAKVQEAGCGATGWGCKVQEAGCGHGLACKVQEAGWGARVKGTGTPQPAKVQEAGRELGGELRLSARLLPGPDLPEGCEVF